MTDGPAEIPRPRVETIVMGDGDHTLAIIQGAVWPRIGSVFELGNPNRDAIVKRRPAAAPPERCLHRRPP